MEWAYKPFLAIGGAQVSAVKLVEFVLAVVIVVVVSRSVAALLGSRLLSRTRMDRGLQYAISRLAYYVLLVLGLLIALQTSGIEVGSLAVILGALGVGVGFGLQTIVNNAVSGLILLIERPIQVGDWIELSGIGGRVARIGARSTTIINTDNIAMIVPNSDLVTQRVVNWSYGDPTVRFRIPVGVAYGSDIEKVRDALLEVAAAHPSVLRDPAPAVFFSGFGDSALNLELAVWTRDMVYSPVRFRSDLNFAIDAGCRRHGVTIPFPQRDLHFKSGSVHVAGDGRSATGAPTAGARGPSSGGPP
jgi:potassium efflux system protein